jgi:predicted DNA-binding protein
MLDMKLLENVRFVVNSRGQKAAVQLDLKTWNALLGYLEEMEDRTLVKENLNRLAQGPENSKAIAWDEAKKE